MTRTSRGTENLSIVLRELTISSQGLSRKFVRKKRYNIVLLSNAHEDNESLTRTNDDGIRAVLEWNGKKHAGGDREKEQDLDRRGDEECGGLAQDRVKWRDLAIAVKTPGGY